MASGQGESRKYQATGSQAEFEPGSRGRVLRNLLGITRLRDIKLAESQALLLAQRHAVESYSEDHRFAAADICSLHKDWLGPIYPWAGEYRDVNMGKGGFQFAHAPRVPALMAELEHGPLARYTPCQPASDALLAVALATVCRADPRSSISRRQRSRCTPAGHADGFAGRVTAVGLFPLGGERQGALHRRNSRGRRPRLRAARGNVFASYRPDLEARCFQ